MQTLNEEADTQLRNQRNTNTSLHLQELINGVTFTGMEQIQANRGDEGGSRGVRNEVKMEGQGEGLG